MGKQSSGKSPNQGQSRKQKLRETRREEARKAAEREAQKRKQMMILGGIAAVAIVAVLALILVNRDDSSSGLPAVVAAPQPLTVTTDGLTMGDAAAPITVVEYGDYQCPYCGDFSRNGLPSLIDEFVATGQVRFEYVPMSFLGDESRLATQASLCANDQGQFWEMHESIYNNQFGENRGAFSRSRLDQMAEKIGLDMSAYNSCMDNGDQEGAVANYAAVAQQNGITSTPTFVIANGEPIGWSNWAALRDEINRALGN